MNIIIPLGGKGERFTKDGFNIPKPLIKIYDKEMIFYVLDNMSFCKEDKVFIIYKLDLDNYNFKNIVKAKYQFIHFIPIHYQTSGAVETALLGLEYIKKLSPHIVCAFFDCDTFYTVDMLSIIREQNINSIFYVKRENDEPIYSYITMGYDNLITNIKEKIKISANANTGCYVFNDIDKLTHYCKHVLDNKITFKGEPYMSCVIAEMIKSSEFYGHELNISSVYSLGIPREIDSYLKSSHCWLFDLDGTLVNTDDIYYGVWETILKKYNICLTPEIFKKYIHGNSDTHVIKMLIPFSTENISELKDTLFMENIQGIKIIEGVNTFMKYLTEMGHKCSIVTNCNRRVAEKIALHCGFNKCIDFIIAGDECSSPKPSPDPYLMAIRKYNTTSDRCIIIEDSTSGLLSGRLANPNFLIGITTNYSHDELIANGATNTIDNYMDIDCIMNFLNKSNNNSNLQIIKQYVCDCNIFVNEQILYVIIDDNKLKGGYISDVLSLNIKTNFKSIDCVLKLENANDTPLSVMATKLGLYDRENYFYENISKYVNVSIPTFYGLIKNNDMHTIGILMENLYKRGNFIVNLDLNNVDIDISLKIIDSISKLHVKFWNKNLEKNFKQLKKHNE